MIFFKLERTRCWYEVTPHNNRPLFLDGVYLDAVHGAPARFRWVKAPTSDELTGLAHRISQRTARFLERKGLLARDADDCMDARLHGMEEVERCLEQPSRR